MENAPEQRMYSIEDAGMKVGRIKTQRGKRIDYKGKYFTMRGWVVLLACALLLLGIAFISRYGVKLPL